MRKILILVAAVSLLCFGTVVQAAVTGDPVADGWLFGGHSLANGTYVRGDGNYGYEVYTNSISLVEGETLAPTWLPGDLVLGAGGVFASIDAPSAGWTAFTGGAVNGLLRGSSLKLQVKFGTSECLFSPSTVAPNAGDGIGSLNPYGGNGAVQVRNTTSVTSSYWQDNAGTIQPMKYAIRTNGDPSTDVVRMIWTYGNGYPATWEILLNTSLLRRLDGGSSTFLFPTDGDKVLLTVQDGTGKFTDALAVTPRQSPAAVPEPATLLGFGLPMLMVGLGKLRGLHK